MRKIIVSAALLCAGLGVAAPAASASVEAFGPPPKCIPVSQSKLLGLEREFWAYLRTEGNTLFYDYYLNSVRYGQVSCTS